MSENEELSETSSDTQLLTAEYKDGQLQIVEMAPFDKGGEMAPEGSDMPSLEGESSQAKYVQVVNPDKSVMQLDLLNLTLVRCEDGSESYRLVSSAEVGDVGTEATVTCVLHSSDNEVMLTEGDNGETYVMMEGGNPLVLYQSQPEAQGSQELTPQTEPTQPPKLTPNEILEKAKALQKTKNILRTQIHGHSQRGRKRKSEFPNPHELLSSPNFKLYLYSCKFCSFKCNAIKEMTAHKAAAHSAGRDNNTGKWRGARPPSASLQCALCPYRGSQHSQLMKHIQDIHSGETIESNKVLLDTAEVAAADVLVCGACGYESASRPLFRRHIETVHGATAC
ncbi:hypothetical protein ABMA28_011320 [Loxostege sticticalis]|uniref:C2H2-type domain-containing protein n=1 Tax=Loxostege sticticalis TaxID=481309 RepID=A0ABD0S6Y5_LOXSC